MFGSKRSIFIRILMATLLPLILIFSLVIITINRIVFEENAAFARESTILFSEQVAMQINDKISTMSGLLNLTSKNISSINPNDPDAEKEIEKLLVILFKSTPSADKVWITLEEETFNNNKPIVRTYIKNRDIIKEQTHPGDPDLYTIEAKSPRQNRQTDLPFIKIGPYDSPYGNGQNEYKQPSGTIVSTIKRNNQIIGYIGVEILYSRIIDFLNDLQIPNKRRVAIISREGEMFSSTDNSSKNQTISDLGLDKEEQIQTAMMKAEPFMDEAFSLVLEKELFLSISPINIDNADKQLFLYIEFPTEIFHDKATKSVQIIITTSILGLLLLSASIFFATRKIVKPIKKITENANQIANGQLDVIFDEIDDKKTNKNEIEILQIALIKMLSQLNQIHELKLESIKATFEKEKLEETAKSKTQFFASMSHEIRTPMNAISGMAELLMAENLTPKQQKYAKDIKISAGSLLSIINDILDFSKMETTHFSLIPVHYDFPMMIENTCSMIKMMAKEKKLQFIFEPEGSIPHCLYGDDLRLRQILINILSNSVKYTKKGYVKLKIHEEHDSLIFEISDSGVGIKAESLPYIFEPFKQVDLENNKQIEGTGLGLSITQKLAELMKGNISVQSEYGKGSTFTIQIPRILGDESKLKEKTLPTSELYAPNIKALVVDDNEINLNVAQGLLSLFGI